MDSRAIQINVLPLNSVCMVCWIFESVSKSTDALRERYKIVNGLIFSDQTNLRSFVQDNNLGISHECTGKAEKRLLSYTQVRSSSFYDGFKGNSPSRGLLRYVARILRRMILDQERTTKCIPQTSVVVE